MIAGSGSWRGRRPEPAFAPAESVHALRDAKPQTPVQPAADPPSPAKSEADGLLQDVLASCPDPLFVVGPGGEIDQMNPAGSSIRADLGLAWKARVHIRDILERVDLLAGPITDPPFDVPRIGDLESLVDRAASPRERVYDLRVRARQGDAPRRGGYIVQLLDVTPLLNVMRRGEAAKRHRDGILSLLSHDLRSPHAAILATVNHPDFAGVPSNLRQIIERAARRSLNMVDSLVRSVRAESAEYDLEETDLAHILEEVADSTWPKAQENNTRIDLALGDGPYPVLVDRAMLSRAISDTLGNLISFGLPGQPIVCRLVRSGPDDTEVTCEIIGTVRQVSEGELARIFSRFASSQKSDIGSLGDGDGLQLARTVFGRHGGRLDCRQLDHARRLIAFTLPLTGSRLDRRCESN